MPLYFCSGESTTRGAQRFEAFHRPHSNDWVIRLKNPRASDDGEYHCQVSTTPHSSPGDLARVRAVPDRAYAEADDLLSGDPDLASNLQLRSPLRAFFWGGVVIRGGLKTLRTY